MCVEFDDDVRYPAKGWGFIFFWMWLGDVLELNDVLFVSRLLKNLISVSCMSLLQYRVAFEGQHCTINDCGLTSLRNFARGV
jgi:hypothetical protein